MATIKAGTGDNDVLEYKCNTSVAPQLLETATVTINPGYEDATDHHHYQLLPHLLVVSEKNHTSSFWKAGSSVDDGRIVSGVSLEPILDGPLAASNPHSTARTAIAVGGVVSVAISNNTKSDELMKVGNYLYWDRINGYAKLNLGSKGTVLACVPYPAADASNPNTFGKIVDTDELQSENYVRVKLV